MNRDPTAGASPVASVASPDFAGVDVVRIENVKTGERATLVRADRIASSPALVDTVVAICNEPLVYDTLFRPRLRGQPYTPAKAEQFLAGARQRWTDRSGFVFFIVRSDGSLAGNVDVMGNDPSGAEIGYWATANAPGFVTPSVRAVCELARSAGFKLLYARVLPHNERSMGVLRRAGFEHAGVVGTPPEVAHRFERHLD